MKKMTFAIAFRGYERGSRKIRTDTAPGMTCADWLGGNHHSDLTFPTPIAAEEWLAQHLSLIHI